ncbi:MAG TPA: WG repeat-containing protein [Clostridia bacterium]|nr:WG repeat-containing protein [Clostridia bacterium]
MNRFGKTVVLLVLSVILAASASCGTQRAVSTMDEVAGNASVNAPAAGTATSTDAGTAEGAAQTAGTAVITGAGIGTDLQPEGNGTADTREIKLYPARENYLDNKKTGYIDSTGKFVIEPLFSQVERFQDNGLAIAGKDDKYGIIDVTGRFIAEPVYDYINNYSEGLAIAYDQKGSVVLDESGRALSDKYSYIGSYKNKRAIYQTKSKDGTLIYGYLDETGKPVIKAAYQNATDFEGGRASVMISEQQYALIDLSGNTIKTFNYTYVGRISDGMMEFRKIGNDKSGYLDINGNIVIQPAFSYAGAFEEGIATASIRDASDNNRYGLIDRTGRFVIQPEYSDVRQLGDNMVAVGKSVDPEFPPAGTRYALAGQNGKLLTDFIYYDILQPFKDGTASVSDGKELYFVDANGKRIDTLPSAEGSGMLEKTGELIYVDADRRSYYMNEKGETVYKPASSLVLDGGVTISETKFKPNRDYLVYYPTFSGMADAKAEEALNKLLASDLEDTSTAAVKPEDNLDYTYDSSFSVGLQKKDLLVLERTGYYYPKGAAHGMPSQEYLHIDLKNGSVYQLKDLFKSGSNYAKVLSDIVGKQMRDRMAVDPENNLYWTEDYKGIQKDQPFYITGDSLVLYFTPYEIAPYAAGFPEFSIKFDELSGILNKDGAFWRSFN